MNTSALINYVFVLMGVSGSGKSVVANEVAYRQKAAFLDGDFLHPRANIQKMSQGQALNDDDRRPWLQALNDAVFAMQRTNRISLLVCSALKKRYRDQLRDGNTNLSFIYLQGDVATIESRLRARKGHFFRPQMLETQFASLEEPGVDEPDVFVVNIAANLSQVIAATTKIINNVMNESGDNN